MYSIFWERKLNFQLKKFPSKSPNIHRRIAPQKHHKKSRFKTPSNGTLIGDQKSLNVQSTANYQLQLSRKNYVIHLEKISRLIRNVSVKNKNDKVVA
jgi:hypothetical protein